RTTVSTTNIPISPPGKPGSQLHHQNEGSLLDADHPANGVPFARRSTGVATGWNYVEYEALGYDFDTRGPRLSEQIPFLRRLWSEPLVTFEGRFDKIDRGNICPRPGRNIPIYHGGFADVAFKRSVKMCDGFIFPGSLESVAQPGYARIKELLAEAGRPLESFGMHWLMMNDGGAGMNPDKSAEYFRRWQDLGGTHISIVTMGQGFRTIDEHIDYLAEVKHRIGAG
ncbi:LLM class flavin-dependent oxidoreductase, partial [Novosphingobium colocasiae]|uniref:LLM class flavin-dependent oxidoreductase n=1 Tax=Novosphingobium colocasiae TaxID=1256513 RepID=UPI0035AD9090